MSDSDPSILVGLGAAAIRRLYRDTPMKTEFYYRQKVRVIDGFYRGCYGKILGRDKSSTDYYVEFRSKWWHLCNTMLKWFPGDELDSLD